MGKDGGARGFPISSLEEGLKHLGQPIRDRLVGGPRFEEFGEKSLEKFL